MNILWVEDFDDGKGERASQTRFWLDAVLCEKVKQDLKKLDASDPISFLSTLAENDPPIVWADSLAAGLAASRLGTAAYAGNKYSKIPPIRASYDVALLDLAVPCGKSGGQLSERYSEDAQSLLDAEEKNNTFSLEDPGLKAFPAVILAIRLMQRGMPAERIFFLTANADVSSMPASVKSILGPELLKKNIIGKTGKGIEGLLRRVENDAYYQLKRLINSVSQELLSFIEQSQINRDSRPEFKFSKPEQLFLFENKEDTTNFLRELIDMLPLHLNSNDKSICDTIANKILREFDAVDPPYEYDHEKHTADYLDSIPARFYARILKYLRNINAHSSYLKKMTACETGIIFLLFIGYLCSVYHYMDSNQSDRENMIATAEKFFDCESILNGGSDLAYDNKQFMHDTACRYTEIVKKDASSPADCKNWFLNITVKLSDGLDLTAWDVLRMTFWSQVSYTPQKPLRFKYVFDTNTQALRAQQFFRMLGKRLALSKKGCER